MKKIAAMLLLMSAAAFAETFDYHTVRGREVKTSETGLLEGEHLPMRGTSRTQGLRNFGPDWSGDAHLLWDGLVGESMETSFPVAKTGPYRVTMRLTKAPDYGRFTLSLNGQKLSTGIDLYAPRVEIGEVLDLGVLALKAGGQKLVFTLTGANPKARKFRGKGYLMGLDYVKLVDLTPLPITPVHPPPGARTAPSAPPAVTLRDMQPVLATYCYDCHGNKAKVKGKVNLKAVTTREGFLADIELTRKVSEALAYHDMPPDDEKQPPEDDYRKLRTLFDSLVDEYLQSNRELPPVVMRRMNRYEYNNAVRDLLELRGDLYPLPEKVIRGRDYFDPASGRLPDVIRVSNRALGKNQIEQHILTGVTPFAIDLQAEHGFNNRGDQLSLSPILLESFLKLGRSIVNSPEFDGYSGLSGSLFAVPEGTPPGEEGRIAARRLGPFLERAFRAAIEPETTARYVKFFEREVNRGASFRQAMKNVVTAVLASPRFLYLNERKRETGSAEPLNAHELAARLSFFLWSSIPDEELLGTARDKSLLKPAVYAAQVRRMLEHKRSKALAENFARQWLRLDQLITAVPDFERFETYYARIGCEQWKFGLQTMIEPLLLFESVMVEDRSIMLLVDSNYAYRSSEVQSWYKDEVPFGKRANRNRFNTGAQEFRRVPLDTRREGGVMTSAAVLTMTSSPLRTSPIIRGAWVLTVIFNKPPPPPPDTVPEIEKDDAEIEAKGLTLRQRLIAHQEDKSCASCHSKIDPLGFALENYDAVGRWRETYRSGLPIDAGGELFGEATFTDVIGLKDALLANPEWFVRGFSEHLLSYALGRELELADKLAVDKIVRKVLADHGKFSTVASQVATSYPFLHKTNQEESEE